MQRMRSVCKKSNTKGSRSIEITKQMFDHSPMVFKFLMHKLREFIHEKGNLQFSHPEMLEATNHLTVHDGINRLSTINSSQRSTHGKQCRDRFGAKHVMFAQNINDKLLLK